MADRNPQRPLVLASSSRYRRELLARLGLSFETRAADIDETPFAGEAPTALVKRLARQKAETIAPDFPQALIIGSDQCAELKGALLGKPGNFERAFAQLRAASGQTMTFRTGLCVLDAASGRHEVEDIIYAVRFRHLGTEQISNYLEREQPYDCAGSFRAEA
ncbi:MAG: Maf family protein, partial [Gammaproteobacteria bacterium]